MFERLEDEVDKYNKTVAADGGRACIQRYIANVEAKQDAEWQEHAYSKPKAIQQKVESPFILAIVMPFMARAHWFVRQAGELVFCDATASLDRLNTPIYIMSAATAAGAIPLAVVMTSGKDVETMKQAFEILKTILPSDAFFGQGAEVGPMGFMTDDSTSERQTLKEAWPQATLFLCAFHILQST
jgi:hypothetical protein